MPMTLNISVHVVILFTILALFFMIYVSKIEKQSLNSEISSNIGNALNKLGLDNSGQPASPELQKLKDMYSKTDATVEMHNKWLFRSLIMTNVGALIFVVLLFSLLSLQCNQCVPIKKILTENTITFIIVGFIEFMFFKHVASRYIPTKPSLIVEAFFNKIEQKL